MNPIKRYLGIIWMALAPALVIFMFWQAYEKIDAASAAARSNTILQWAIILAVFLPICAAFFIFGMYAFTGEYDHLPESSVEITDYDAGLIE